jgi:hypothetical protein
MTMAATATARSSAPARRAPARKPAAPRPATAAGKRRRTGHTPVGGFVPVAAVGGAVGGLADSGLFVWLTRGRLWIGVLGTLLVGIVALNVFALSFSASSSNAGQAADVLNRQNSSLRAEIAKRLSNTEIQDVAAEQGLVMPAAGSIGYLSASPGDAKKAAQRLRDGELVAGAAAPVAPVAPATTVTSDPVVADPAVADPAAVAPPVAEVAPPATTAPVTPAPETVAPAAAASTSAGGAVGAP